MYDITSRSSFENLKNWLEETKNYGNEKIVVLLLGNKSDLSQEKWGFLKIFLIIL